MLRGMQDWPLRISRILDHAAREHGQREIVSRYADGQVVRTNWAGIDRDARRLANAATRLGLARGDRIATLAMNHDRHLVAWYGVIGMGGVLHTLNPRLSDDHLVYIVNHAQDRAVFYDRAFASLVERIKPRIPTVQHFICFDPGQDDQFQDLLRAETEDFEWVEGDEREPAMLCYTSGTTGDPKGVLYEHRSTVLHAITASLPDLFDLSARAVVMPIVPMFHAAAWGLPFAAGVTGATLVFTTETAPEVIRDLIHAEHVTHSAAVPTVWLALMGQGDDDGAGYRSLRVLVIGGAAAPRTMIEHFDGLGIRVAHAWGMTEMSPIGTLVSPDLDWQALPQNERTDRLARQGRPPFGIELRTVDNEGRALPRDGRSSGLLQSRGAWVIDRYFLDSQTMAAGVDGWFDTGDVAILHPDGSMQITDRAKDVIKSGGEWISSIQLENAALGCEGVVEAAAISVPDTKWGERPVLVVVRSDRFRVTEETILRHLANCVARWWIPDRILFVDSLPYGVTGKIQKAVLREQLRQ